MRWFAFEYLHFNWDLSWPWLALEMVSAYPLVQWYEYTGVMGGSLWILIANVLAYRILQQKIYGHCIMGVSPIVISF